MEYIVSVIGAFTALSVLSTSLYNRQKSRLDLQTAQIEALRSNPKMKMNKIDDLQEQINRTDKHLRNWVIILIFMAIILTFGGVYYVVNQVKSGIEANHQLNMEQTEILKRLETQ